MASFNEDVTIRGHLSASTMSIPNATLKNAAVAADAAIDAGKLVHRNQHKYSQNGSATTVTIPLFAAVLPGEILTIKAGSIGVATSDADVTIDLKKNGVSIMNGGTPITLDSGNTARVVENGTLDTSATAYVAGDFFELVITATANSGAVPTGLLVQVEADEAGS